MPVPANLIHESTTGTGTGNLTLAAVNGRRRFIDGFVGAAPNTFDYFICSQAAAEWERGTGHMADANTLVRDTCLQSSNANALVNFTAGTKDVMNDVPAQEQMRAAVNLAEGPGGVASIKAARANLKTESLAVMGDADLTIDSTIRFVSCNGTTVPRFLTLPLVSTCNPGHMIRIANVGGSAVQVTVRHNAADASGAAVVGINNPGAWCDVVTDGTAGWYNANLKLPLAHGGTGGNSQATALTSLGAQPVDSDLTAIAALTTTAYGRALLTLADGNALAALVDANFLTPAEGAAAFQPVGSYQPSDSDLTAIAALATTAYGRSLLTLADVNALRSNLGLGTAAYATTGNLAGQVPVLDGAGVIGDYDLPARLGGAAAQSITDWNLATENGWFMTAPGAIATNHAPTADTWYLGFVQVHNVQWTTQIVHAFANMNASDSMTWRRRQVGGTWETSWTKLYSSAGDIAPLTGVGFSTFGDADYVITPTERNVLQAAATANRVVYLPLSTSVPIGTKVSVTSYYLPTAFTLTVAIQSPDYMIAPGSASGIGSVALGPNTGFETVTFLAAGGAWYIVGGSAIAAGGAGHYTKIGQYDTLMGGPVSTIAVGAIVNLDNATSPTVYLSGTNTNIEQMILGLGKRRYVYVGGPSTGNKLFHLTSVAGGNIVCEGSADMVLNGGDSFEVAAVAAGQVKIHSWTSLRGQQMTTGGSQVPVKAGYQLTPYTNANLTNGQTFTPNPLNHNYQIIGNNSTSGQNVTIAAPTVDCAIDILWVNGGVVAGSVTFSGFMVPAGEPVPTTAANARFIISIRRIGTVSTFVVKALQ